uniref:Uncharacterized protein n=1 Tax=Ditylum brightwellii TaxID=49249 RepID=A0A6V2F681_9STRA|mmetsp:Transcript_59872/g.88868  ORF Transcript_59872/g.88868 Transcript_59872/m.88868 type:complete len:249 (+) Transcript_59872:377-1123(+)
MIVCESGTGSGAGIIALLNSSIKEIINDKSSASCPESLLTGSDGIVDWRDLLMSPSDALAAGAPGTSPYVNRGQMIKGIIDDYLLAPDKVNGTPKIDDVIVCPLTKAQSDVEGQLRFDGDVLSLDASNVDLAGVKSVTMRMYNASISNLDTFGREVCCLRKTIIASRYSNPCNWIYIAKGRKHAIFSFQRRQKNQNLKNTTTNEENCHKTENDDEKQVEKLGVGEAESEVANYNHPFRRRNYNKHCYI